MANPKLTASGALIDIEIGKYSGESFDDLLLIIDDDAGAPMNLDDVALHLEVRDKSGVSLLNATDGNLGLEVDRDLGTVAVPAMTAAWCAGIGATTTDLDWDLFASFSGGPRRMTHKGKIAILAAATRYP